MMRRLLSLGAALLFVATVLSVPLFLHPNSPLPNHWNPLRPLSVTDPVSPLTLWKLRWAERDEALCRSILSTSGRIEALDPKYDSDTCHIANRVMFAGTNDVKIPALETSCAIALRTTMWITHDLQPQAIATMESALSSVRHIGSYNCRPIRTGSGDDTRMSTHATAEAIDIVAFAFADGSHINLMNSWESGDRAETYFRLARDSACFWFETVLSPEFNDLHKDHFHLQSKGWGTCR